MSCCVVFQSFAEISVEIFSVSDSPDSGLATLEEATMQIVSRRLVLGCFQK